MNRTTLLFLVFCICITANAQQKNEGVTFKADTIRDDSGEIISIIQTKVERKEEPQVSEKVLKETAPIKEVKYKEVQTDTAAKEPEKKKTNVGFKVESEEETIEISDIKEETEKDSIPVVKAKAVSEGVPVHEVTKVSDLKGDLIIGDTIFDEFGRISSIRFNKVIYNEVIVSGQPRIITKKTPFITLYSYQDDIFKPLGVFHIVMGALNVALGIEQLILGIVIKSPPTAITSSVPLILGSVEIGIGGRCIKHRKKFWKLYKDSPARKTIKLTTQTGPQR